MFDKLKSFFGKDADASKSQRTSPLKSRRQPIEPVTLSLHEIGSWLDEQEISCKKERSESLSQSREVITQLLSAIREAVIRVDNVQTDDELHPKVIQVNTQQLPLFKSKILSALDVTFSDDDEEFYSQNGLMLNAIMKAFRGPGRYLHQSYPMGIHVLRDKIDLFGKEINVMTAVIKSSRERLAHIEDVRQAHANHEEFILESTNVDIMKDKMKTKLKECEEELMHAKSAKAAYYASEEYRNYEYYRTARDQGQEVLSEAERTLQIKLSVSIQVWKRAMYEFPVSSDKKSADILSKLILYVEENGVGSDSSKVLADLTEIIKPLFHLIDAGNITLKNSAERTYFSSETEYIEALKCAFEKYHLKRVRYEEASMMLAKQRAPAILLEMQEKVQKLEDEMKDIEMQISKTARREAHMGEVEDLRSALLEKMTACVNYNSQTEVPVSITDLADGIS